MVSIANGWVWLGFSIFLVFALGTDFLFSGKVRHPSDSMKAALSWTLVWVLLALLFNLLLWFYLDSTTTRAIANEQSLHFFTGYLIEKSLSVDNLFVFYVIFQQFHLPIPLQQRVFSIGIWSAIILRLIFILLGTWLISHFHWVLYVMGGFLFLTGIKIIFSHEKEKDLADTLIIRACKKIFRVTHQLHGNRFFIFEKAKWTVTPLFITLIFIELSDLVFALDSIPAIFAITHDPFIVWSSNIFAILGLRALYFLLAGMVSRFYLLKYGIALVLIFVGVKMLVEPWWEISALMSLFVIVFLLAIFTTVSFMQTVKIKNR